MSSLEPGRDELPASPAAATHGTVSRWQVIAALFAVYVIWGSTYVAMAVGVDHFPPFLLGGLRYTIAGLLLFAWLCWRGIPLPRGAEWRGGIITGFLLLVVGNGSVNTVVMTVSSGLAALVIASSALFAAAFARMFGDPVSRREWAGILVGMAGVASLASEGELRGGTTEFLLLLLASASWGFGSMLAKHLPQPASPWSASAAQLLCGGVGMLLISLWRGESWAMDAATAGWFAMIYLAIFGALVAFSAYIWLLRHTRPALATSTAYVNPVIAVALGALLLAEPVSTHEIVSMLVVLGGVVLVTTGGGRRA